MRISAIKKSKGSRNANNRRDERSIDNIDQFFAEYPNFDYDSSRPIWTEFNRMCRFFGWNKDDEELKDAKGEFKVAMVKQFNDIYGKDPKNLQLWQKLCHVLNIEPVPTRLAECRE
ncbi:hypothetical protein ACHAP8_012499, partial [Fusarium lateritium]